VLEQPSTVTAIQALAFLVDELDRDVSAVEYVGEGAWSRCFGFVEGDREYVIRFGRHVDDFQRDRWAAQFGSIDLPVPQVIHIGPAFGAWCAISTRARGRPLEQLDASDWAATQPALLAAFDALRRAALPANCGYGPWDAKGVAPHPSWSDYLATVGDDPPHHRTHGWRARLAESPIGERSFRRGYATMMELAGAFTDVPQLVHNDLLNRNALAADGRITGVFDWGCSIYGDAVYELATFVFWSPWHTVIGDSSIVERVREHHAAIAIDVADFEARLRCCALHIGLVHIGYNAFIGDFATQARTEERMLDFLD
jgi:hygromycin-B 4-O-kinase